MPNGSAIEQPLPPAEYTVSEIALRVKRVVEDHFGFVRVRGEISKATVNAASGHCYLTLKDDKSVLDAVCWKGTMARLKQRPEAGMEVIASGKLTTYPGRSNYQLVIEAMEPAGIGALMALLEKRKHMLAAEGLFDPARKKPLPFLPQTIGIITSPTGAVIRDMLHRLADRFPRPVLLWPVAVQGEHAAAQIAAAIAGFNRLSEEGLAPPSQPSTATPAACGAAFGLRGIPRPELLIVARGGGSIEDLWAFNEEIVVRAAAASAIPLISAVGHETDTTLIDYAADKRAPTPTGAAEFAVPVREELLNALDTFDTRMRTTMRTRLRHAQEKLEHLSRAIPRPQQMVSLMAQRLDEVTERLALALPRLLAQRQQTYAHLAARVSPRLLMAQWQQRMEKLLGLAALLESLNVTSVLKRGFAIVRRADGTLIATRGALPETGVINIEFHDGAETRNVTS